MTATPLVDAAPSPVDEAEFAALKAEIRDYVDNQGERWTERIEAEREVPTELWEELRERGYLRLAAPRSLGGRGLPFARYLELIEQFSRPHASLRMIVHVMNGLWRAMLPYANAEQLDRFVRAQVATEIRVAFTLTEPDAGTGADIKCSVVREGDTYYLSGQKHLITFGCISDYLLLFARLEGSVGTEGTVALMVPAHGEGIENNPMPESMGVLGTDHAHLIFERAPVPVANRLGEEGEGLDVALGGFLVPSRISVAMTCVGLASKALDLLLVGERQHRPPQAVHHVHDHPQRRVRAGEQLDQLQVARERQPAPTERLGRRQAQIAALAQLVPEFARDGALGLDPLGPALALVVDVRADLGLQRRELSLVDRRGICVDGRRCAHRETASL